MTTQPRRSIVRMFHQIHRNGDWQYVYSEGTGSNARHSMVPVTSHMMMQTLGVEVQDKDLPVDLTVRFSTVPMPRSHHLCLTVCMIPLLHRVDGMTRTFESIRNPLFPAFNNVVVGPLFTPGTNFAPCIYRWNTRVDIYARVIKQE